MSKYLRQKVTKEKPLHLSVSLFLCFVLLMQGGYSDAVWCASGVILLIYLLVKLKYLPPLYIIISLPIFFASMLFSAFLSGLSYEGMAAAIKPLILLATITALCNMSFNFDSTLFYSGMMVAVIGIITFFLPTESSVVAGRLQGVFQYANATGIYLAVCAFYTRQTKCKHYAVLMEIALLLTQSIGSILVYIFGWVVFFCTIGRKKITPVLRVLLPAAFITALGLVFFIRGVKPFETYIERLIQISDGLSVFAKNPLFGIGPGQWYYHYPEYQSAYYNTGVLHSGYVQVAVSGGIFALLAVVALIFIWLRKHTFSECSICGIMILAHAVFEITFMFFAVCFLLCMVVAKTSTPINLHKKYLRAVSIPAMLLCCFMLYCAWQKNYVDWKINSGDIHGAIEILSDRPFKNDTGASVLQIELYTYLDSYESIKKMDTFRFNAQAYHFLGILYRNRGDYSMAAENALRSIECSVFWPDGYALLDEITLKLEPAEQIEYQVKMDECKSVAEMRLNPLFAFIGR